MNIRAPLFSTTLGKALSVVLVTSALIACGGSNTPDINNPGDDNDIDPPNTTVDLDFVIQSHNGARLEGANVALGEEESESDTDGKVSFNYPTSDEVVVTAEMDGYIRQSVTVPAEEDSITPIRLVPVKQILTLDAIEDARVISANDLGARITFPADAFVTPDGEPAEGSATVQVTPWDITNGELNAMLGNGQALDDMGERTELISAGMITVDIYNDDGEYLQLASEATAEIQMDLPLDSINNETLSIGSTIPMWHFDEELGLWVEDNDTIGTVVASATSPVGLAVHAQVSHFSTWNWDFKFENGGSINVECRREDSSVASCAVTAEVTLDDGSTFTRNGQLPEGGSTIINMPNSADIEWYASSDDNLLGQESSDMSGDVIIELKAPASSNNVRCELPDGTPVNCEVTLTDGTNTLTQTISTQGATVITPWTGVDETTTLTWSAHTPNPVLYNQQNVLAEGSVTSDNSEAVVIALDTTPIEEVEVTCAGTSGAVIPCTLDIIADIPNDSPFSATHTLHTGSDTVQIPAETTLVNWSATSNGAFSQNGQFVSLSGSADTGLVASLTVVLDEEVVEGSAAESIDVSCVNGQDTAATSCNIEVEREGRGIVETLESVPVGEVRTVEFPDGMGAQQEWIFIHILGDDDSFANDFTPYPDLVGGELFELELSCSSADGQACP